MFIRLKTHKPFLCFGGGGMLGLAETFRSNAISCLHFKMVSASCLHAERSEYCGASARKAEQKGVSVCQYCKNQIKCLFYRKQMDQNGKYHHHKKKSHNVTIKIRAKEHACEKIAPASYTIVTVTFRILQCRIIIGMIELKCQVQSSGLNPTEHLRDGL